MLNQEALSIFDKATRLIKSATGEEYGDGEMVTDVGVGIAEPGYGDDETVWVLGNWNPKRFPRGDEAPLTKKESLPERLGDALERIGAEVLWLDEWTRCDECQRIFRSVEDSYTWRMYGAVTNHGDVLCWDHVIDDLEWFLEEADYINNPRVALTNDVDLAEYGFEQFNGKFANGWHPGQTDKPEDADKRAQEDGWQERVFKIDDVGQFDLRFSLWVRNNEEEMEDEEMEELEEMGR